MMNNNSVSLEDVASISDAAGSGEGDISESISALVWMQLLTGLVGIMGNFLVCFVFLHRRTQKNQTNLLITNQAFVDLSSSILLVIHVIYDLAGRPSTDVLFLRKLSCYFWRSQCILFACFAISTFNLTIISLERYCATIFPHSYPSLCNRRNLRFAIVTVWLVSPVMQYILAGTTYTFSEDGRCVPGWAPVWVGILLFLWEYFLPVTVMTYSFASVTRKLRRMNRVLNNNNSTASHFASTAITSVTVVSKNETGAPSETSQSHAGVSKTSNFLSLPSSSMKNGHESSVSISCSQLDKTHSQLPLPTPSPSPSSSSPSSNIRVTVRRRNATKTLLTVYVVYIICWSPNQWAFFQLNLGGTLDFQSFFYEVSVILVMLNTCVNPFIYALRHKTYKERVRELVREFKRKILRNN